jgi:hypothetical protein
MRKKYYMSAMGIEVLVIILGVGFLFMSVPLITSASWRDLAIFVAPVVTCLALLWLCLARGTYITLDENGYIYNTFFFIKRNTIPISRIISLTTRHPILLLGRGTQVWSTYYNQRGQVVTKGLVTRETLKGKDFRDLIGRLREINPKIMIADELLDDGARRS